ncbi:hypothetical protein CsatB_009303 [Cannabis sativa]|jgi:hypothetical protein|uniref:Uncharacterized protein n=2 Tax=Cannabis sativa TaxID=3483 RepID=A0AB40E643_CANSA|nr:uncharacterized protein LOC115705582 [Cannabis sativa]KAF4363493.1 hypothetical protein G4B88_016197 [Cannabis sativa]KAF4386215.1 hypothetical protein F8388_016467 [Cannabis sativa]
MKQNRHGPSQDPLKAHNFSWLPDRASELFALLMRIGLLVCLVASISLALHSAFWGSSSRRFALPDRTTKFPDYSAQNDDVTGPTNISHVIFGIGASVHTWRERSRYSLQWWDPNATRGFVWLDAEPKPDVIKDTVSIPYRVSEDWTRFKYSSSRAAVRIARIVLENFRVGFPNARWFVMGDDDTVFFADNLVSVLGSYDHTQMYYIGGNSESVEQDAMHAYDMAFGGGGFAISRPLAARLAKILDGCLDRYYRFYGSDQRIWACLSELGVSLTRHRGFHQLDIKGNPYGLLAAHPLVPLVSLHHLDYLNPLFPGQTQIESVETLMKAYRVDPGRILQQCFCYDKKRKWSISISWGYTLQIYPFMLAASELQMPLQTFKTWRSSSDGPFTFNTRPVSDDPCQQPLVYFLERVEEVAESGTRSSFLLSLSKQAKKCRTEVYKRVMAIPKVVVTSMKMDKDYWNKVPVRQCCEILDHASVKNGVMQIRIRKCRPKETITF